MKTNERIINESQIKDIIDGTINYANKRTFINWFYQGLGIGAGAFISTIIFFYGAYAMWGLVMQ
ncbi:MAG: hypothetical protein RLZZ292_3932 [Bacteroidota bacterium]